MKYFRPSFHLHNIFSLFEASNRHMNNLIMHLNLKSLPTGAILEMPLDKFLKQ